MANFDGSATFNLPHNSSSGETPVYANGHYGGPRPMMDINSQAIPQGLIPNNLENNVNGLQDGVYHPNQQNLDSVGSARPRQLVIEPSTHHNNTPVINARNIPIQLRQNSEGQMRRISHQQFLQQQQFQMYQQQQQQHQHSQQQQLQQYQQQQQYVQPQQQLVQPPQQQLVQPQQQQIVQPQQQQIVQPQQQQIVQPQQHMVQLPQQVQQDHAQLQHHVQQQQQHVHLQQQHVQPQPQHVQPQPQHVQPQPQHVQPQPQHVQSQPQHVQSQPQHVQSQPQHVQSQPQHVQSQPQHAQPQQPQHAQPQQHIHQPPQQHMSAGSGQGKSPAPGSSSPEKSLEKDTSEDSEADPKADPKDLGPTMGSTLQQGQNNQPNGPGVPNSEAFNATDSAVRQQNALNARAMRRNMGNAAIMRVMDLVELVSSAPAEALVSIGFWAQVCDAFFRPTSTMRFSGPLPRDSNAKSELSLTLYQISMATAPHFLLAQASSHNVRKHEIFLAGFHFQIIPGGLIILVCRMNAIFHYRDGSSGTSMGTCRFLVGRDLFIHQLDCRTQTFEKSISIDVLEGRWNAHAGSQKGNAQNSEVVQQIVSSSESTQHAANAGLLSNAARLLQIGDVMACLHPLIHFSRANKIKSPLAALETLTTDFQKRVRRHSSKSHPLKTVVSTPSPKTVISEDPKILKRRKASSALKSPISGR